MFELPEERLATTTETGDRHYLYPAKTKGPLRTRRTLVANLLIVLFLALPWITINGHQSILLDITHRRFAIFGLAFWAHEVPILFLVLISFILLILLTTALYGRIWCGWACPQTVFIDRIFRYIENLIEGDGIAQRRFNKTQNIPKKILKWSLFLIASLIIAHSFLAYFVGSNHLLGIIQDTPAHHKGAFILMAFATGITLFDFGWFREQFCIIACPYGRLQSVILDENSQVVLYDKTRDSDCINCYRCVQVCPTGIDIRRGTQLECINCTACIDACNQVMTKIQKPKDLIKVAPEKKDAKKIRPRVIIYASLLTLSLATLVYIVSHRNMTPTFITQQRNPVYEIVNHDTIRNGFTLRIQNEQFTPITLTLTAPKDCKLITPIQTLTIQPGQQATYPFFIEFSEERLEHGFTKISLTKTITTNNKTQNSQQELQLDGPLS